MHLYVKPQARTGRHVMDTWWRVVDMGGHVGGHVGGHWYFATCPGEGWDFNFLLLECSVVEAN